MPEKSLVWKPRRSLHYHMDYQVDNDRFTGNTGLTNRKEAEAFARRRRKEEVARRALLGDVGPNMTFLAAADRYMREKGQFRVNAARIERCLDYLVDAIGPMTPVRDIGDRLLAEIVTKRRKMHVNGNVELPLVQNSTVNEEVIHLLKRILIRVRKTWKVHLPDEPNWKDHMLETKQRIREMSMQEEIRVQQMRPDFWPIIDFILLSGVRRSNASIRWEEVDFDEEVIKIRTKFDKPHEIPITPEIRALLDAAKGHHPEFVFTFVAQRTQPPNNGPRYVKGRRYPITYNMLYTTLKRICAKLGIEGLHVHDLRRTSGGRMHRVTGDIASVQEHLGHADVTTTRQHYAHIPTKTIRKRMSKSAKHYAKVKKRAMERLAA